MPKKSSKKSSSIRYTAEQQRNAAESVLLLGESASKVARDLGCSPLSVSSWIAKYRDKIAADHPASVPAAPAKKATGAVPKKAMKKAEPAISSAANIEIVSRGGVTVKFSGDVSPDTLHGIVKRFETD